MKNKIHRMLKFFSRFHLLFILAIGASDEATACTPCFSEDPKFYEILSEHLKIVSIAISNGVVDENGYYVATEKQMDENIAASLKLKDGYSFYFSSSEQQRSVFKKCSFSRIYSLFHDFGKVLGDIKSCSSNSCNKKISQDIAGVTVEILKAETVMCKLELKDKTQ